ncbi:hypothetical protein L7834_018195 [Providencia rettgeri]|nr:hypothetical protein [Providencia rettgeri]
MMTLEENKGFCAKKSSSCLSNCFAKRSNSTVLKNVSLGPIVVNLDARYRFTILKAHIW